MISVLALCACLQTGDARLADVQRKLANCDYRSAWDAMEGITNPVSRAQARARILYKAGDPHGARNAAHEGLRMAEDDLDLLYFAAGSAIWLRDADEAKALATRLGSAVERKSAEVEPADRSAWFDVCRRFGVEVEKLERHEAALRDALRRSRGLCAAILVVAMAGSALVAHYGRSRRPVS